MRITGIGGDIVYKGHSQFMIRNAETKQMEKRRIKNIGMIAGGSGIAPMYQVSIISHLIWRVKQLLQTVADLDNDVTSLSLLYSNRTPVTYPQF